MNIEQDDGGPAFPADRYQVGMSLRDYFAANALAGMLSEPGTGVVVQALGVDTVAKSAYVFADAMLKARRK